MPPEDVIEFERPHVNLTGSRASSGAQLAVVTLKDASWANLALDVAFGWRFDVPTAIDARGWRRASVHWWR